jgi:hypothetical protein
MSAITDIITQLHSIVGTQLAGYQRMPNPYFLERNSALLMRSGYGIGVGAGTNTNRLLNGKISIDRNFEIVLVNQIDALQNDAVNIELEEKAILEAAFILIKYFENNEQLGISNIVLNSRYISDGGIEFIDLEQARFHQLTMTVGVEYIETI